MKKVVLFLSLIMACVVTDAQSSREYIKNSMRSWGVCRNVAITDRGGDVALNLRNQYSHSGIPTGLANALQELHDDSEFIDDVQLT